jgi:ferritin-like metal-binding protein YciE
MKTLENLFMDQLADMYDAEHRIARALPKMAKAATCMELREAIQSHRKETEGHAEKLERVFKLFGKKAKGKKCEATVGLLEEGDEMASEFKGSPAINAALIAAAQKVEHYEMASYGCLREWAFILGNEQAVNLLDEIIEEEKAADRTLNELALSKTKAEGLVDSSSGEAEPDYEAPRSRREGSVAGNRSRREVAID